jgi:hypothetical protein
LDGNRRNASYVHNNPINRVDLLGLFWSYLNEAMARGWNKLGEYADQKGIPSLAGTAEFAPQMNRRVAKFDILRGAVANVVGDVKQAKRSVDLISQEGFVEGGKQAFVENIDHQTDKLPVVGSLKVAFDKTQDPAERIGAVLTAGGEGILVFVAIRGGSPETTSKSVSTAKTSAAKNIGRVDPATLRLPPTRAEGADPRGGPQSLDHEMQNLS